MSRHPLVERIRFKSLEADRFDMKTRGPKVMPKITMAWSPEHDEEARRYAAERAIARLKYGRS